MWGRLTETRGEDADSAMFLATAYMHLCKRPVNRISPPNRQHMHNTPLPPSDLARLAQDVLAHSPEAALPSNLSDQWFHCIARDLACGFDELEGDGTIDDYLAAPLALVLHLLRGQGRTGELISYDELMACLNDYRVEIALEMVNRTTPLQSTPATIETIFRQREVASQLNEGPSPA